MKLGIVGYGNLGKACERVAQFDGDIDEIGIFSRRDNVFSPYGNKVYKQSDVDKCDFDVLALCVGSQNDLQELALSLVGKYNTVDSFDTHTKMADYALKMQKIALKKHTLNFIGIGWDPGLFSLIRGLYAAIMPECNLQTFWGKGVSQGHSQALRNIDGVIDAKQYTIPQSNALKLAREGSVDVINEKDKHKRECYVVAKEGVDFQEIERKIKTMPDYFAGYETEVHFVDSNYFYNNCNGMEHGGVVLANKQIDNFMSRAEFGLKLDSNPLFTASVLVAYAKANYRMAKGGEYGVKTVLDIAISQILQGDWIDKVRAFI